MVPSHRLVVGVLALVQSAAVLAQPAPPPLPAGLTETRIQVRSSLDGTDQPSRLLVPVRPATRPRPLLVVLHTWSYDYTQRNVVVEREAFARDWIALFPNYRGPNNSREGCGSPLAQQDILDAVNWVDERHAIDRTRVFLLGWSGGGHMALLMAARHPDVWAAASASVPVTDLSAFYRQHVDDEFGRDLRACFGAPPEGAAAEAYRAQSPLTHLSPSITVPLDLVVGVHDKVVAPSHTFEAFREVAPAALSGAEYGRLRAAAAAPPDTVAPDPSAADPLMRRPVLLRKQTGRHRFTAFDGGHGVFFESAIAWLAQHARTASR